MAKNHAELLAQHQRQRDLVTVRRDDIDDNSIQGYVLALSDTLVALQYVYDFRLDGLMILRLEDLTEVECSATSRFQNELLVREGLVQAVPFDKPFELENWPAIVGQLSREFSLLIVECEALTPRTVGSVTADILALMPPDATFVNVGRGEVIDEAALVRLAENGRVRIALDVYADGSLPLAPDSRLLALEDAILSPHIAGPTTDLHRSCVALAADNLARFLRGEPLEAPVTLEDYDRST